MSNQTFEAFCYKKNPRFKSMTSKSQFRLWANEYAAERESAIKAMHKKQFDSLRIVCARMVKKNQHESAVSTIDLMDLEEILAAIDRSEQ